jgi:hypothetical protein
MLGNNRLFQIVIEYQFRVLNYHLRNQTIPRELNPFQRVHKADAGSLRFKEISNQNQLLNKEIDLVKM